MTKVKEDYLYKKIGFVSLGCDKNRVDTEKIITYLREYGFEIVSEKEQADIIIVNTCSFLLSAREESVSNILEMAQLKEQNLEKLLVAGCLPMIDDGTLTSSLPEVDKFLIPSQYENIVEILYGLYNITVPKKPLQVSKARALTTPMHYAYLKIADGCNNFCSFCRIPYIRGRYKSEPMKNIIAEAKALVENGVKELILVAQDVTRYGTDYDKTKKSQLVPLLKELSKINDLKWIRLLYCYPEMIDDELIEEIKTNQKIVKYMDIPMQHINSRILKLMGRRSDEQTVKQLITKLRQQIPEIAIRTTFMVGFPSETGAEFKQLCKFLTEYKLENVGFFAYSREEGTRSYEYKYQILNLVKKHRLKKIQSVQQKVFLHISKKHIGNTYTVICDSVEENECLGRAWFSAPDVDFPVYYLDENGIPGEFVNIKITDFNGECYMGERV